MRLRIALASLLAVALLAPAAASAKSKLVLRLTAGHPTPVSFTADTQTIGRPVTLERAERLAREQTIQIVWHTGRDALPPQSCPCDGTAGLKPEKRTRLVNVVVQAMRRDQVVSVAPAENVVIDGNRPNDLSITYSWADDEAPWPRGTRVVVYALFERV
jgi:ABC-type amino acid transport substrate-binding protein